MTDPSVLARRLERLREARAETAAAPAAPVAGPAPRHRGDLAERLAIRLGAELQRLEGTALVRLERPSRPLPIDRARLASLPGQPPADVPLLCLDTETTGLGTATGTLAFLIGLGWWEGDRFRQVQLLLPDQADEPALLAALAATVPAGSWLVTYNGRSFDWPLLETRFRMRRSSPPDLAGHLDLLPLARRLFRHRLPDARLRSVERGVLGVTRWGDIDGAQIPGRYLDALRWGDPEGLVDVVRHNDLDVLALARLLAHVETRLGDASAREEAHPGDLAGLARAFAREGRLSEALTCLDVALQRVGDPAGSPRPVPSTSVSPGTDPAAAPSHEADEATEAVVDGPPWWSPRARADIGGRPRAADPGIRATPVTTPWSEERLLVERARILRRLDRPQEAADMWAALAVGTSRLAAVAAIELAKLREHRLRDRRAALAALAIAWRILDRRRRIGLPEPALEADLVRRGARLRRRIARPAA